MDTVIFNDADKELTEKIKVFQDDRAISFSEAVKELCIKGLESKAQVEWGNY